MLTLALLLLASGNVGASDAVPIDPASWVSADNYPATAIPARHSGTTTVLLSVSRRGLVEECRVVRSSGFADLDNAACMALAQRARFIPARNGHGDRIAASITRTVRWAPPGQ